MWRPVHWRLCLFAGDVLRRLRLVPNVRISIARNTRDALAMMPVALFQEIATRFLDNASYSCFVRLSRYTVAHTLPRPVSIVRTPPEGRYRGGCPSQYWGPTVWMDFRTVAQFDKMFQSLMHG